MENRGHPFFSVERSRREERWRSGAETKSLEGSMSGGLSPNERLPTPPHHAKSYWRIRERPRRKVASFHCASLRKVVVPGCELCRFSKGHGLDGAEPHAGRG